MNTALALTLLRIIAGVSFIMHGWPKMVNWRDTFRWLMKEKFPLPVISTTLLILAEVVGGVLLILGIYTQYVATILALTMVVAVGWHLKQKDDWKKTEAALLLFAICVALAIAGGGAWQLLA
jgi:putative oxidoreductase